MKKLIPILIAVAIVILPMKVFPEAGSPIPIPKISATEAIQLATHYFKERIKEFNNSAYYDDFILLSVEWTYQFDNNPQEEWGWKVKFVHPIDNDHSWVFKVTDEKEVIEMEMTI